MGQVKLTVVALTTCVVGCASGVDGKSDKSESEHIGHTATALQSSMSTYIKDSLQIDQKSAASQSDDANLFTGNDPADNSASYAMPVHSSPQGSWIDWNDLGASDRIANHRMLDEDDAKGRDPTSFPRSNECIGSSQVLSKMDLRYAAAANNSQFALLRPPALEQQRRCRELLGLHQEGAQTDQGSGAMRGGRESVGI